MGVIAMTPDELKQNTRLFDPPDAQFDPARASPQELDAHGLPPKPDQATQPDLFDFWERMVKPPLRPVAVEFEPYSPSDNFLRAGAAPARTRSQSSRNWSGVSVTPRNGRMFTEVTGSWQVPAVSAPLRMVSIAGSTWIGLDGQRRYLDATLPQVGTAQRVSRIAGVAQPPVISFWAQWYPGIPDEQTIPGLQFATHDLAGAWVRVVIPTTGPFAGIVVVRLYIANLSAPPGTPYAAWEWPVPPFGFPGRKVAGGTAEWVMERPTMLGSDVLYELPDYDEVVFDPCYALSANAPGPPTVLGSVEEITGPTLTRMFRVAESPHRAVTISKVERLGSFSFRTFPPPP